MRVVTKWRKRQNSRRMYCVKTAEEYNEVVCQAPPKLYELYYCMYVENNTQESAADKYGYAREHITRLNRQLLVFIQSHLTA